MPPTYKQTKGTNYSGVVEVAIIGYTDVNALAATSTDSILKAGLIPAGAIIIGFYSKTTIPFASVTRPIAGGITLGLDNTVPPFNPISSNYIDSTGTTTLNDMVYFPMNQYLQFNRAAQNIYIGFNWIAEVNPKNYTAGEIKIYIEYKTFPTLN